MTYDPAMKQSDKSEAEIALDALLKAGAVTAEQHVVAVQDVRDVRAAVVATRPDGTIQGMA